MESSLQSSLAEGTAVPCSLGVPWRALPQIFTTASGAPTPIRAGSMVMTALTLCLGMGSQYLLLISGPEVVREPVAFQKV